MTVTEFRTQKTCGRISKSVCWVSLMQKEFRFWMMKKFWRYTVVMIAQQCKCTECHRTVQLKVVKSKFYVYFTTFFRKYFLNQYGEWKEPNTKKYHIVWSHLYKILENANKSIVAESRSVVARLWELQERWTERKLTGSFRVMEMPCILIMVVSEICTSVKMNQIIHFQWI